MKWSWLLAVATVVGVLVYIRMSQDPAAEARESEAGAARQARESKDSAANEAASPAPVDAESKLEIASGVDREARNGGGRGDKAAEVRAVPSSGPVIEAFRAILDGREPDAEALDAIASRGGPDAEAARAAALAASADPNLRRNGLQLAVELGAGGLDLHDRMYRALLTANQKTLLGSKGSLPGTAYTVASGDSLDRIAKKHRQATGIAVSAGLIRLVNGLKNNTIHPNQTLRLPSTEPEIQVSRESRRLRVYVGEALVREYQVCIGKDDKTPIGTFEVETRQEKTPWRNPETGKLLYFGDPDYAIGTRWLGFETTKDAQGIGIHGTNEPESIGKAESLGCIRMRNEEVEELFEFIAIGTSVHVRNEAWFAW
ncbi:MAG: L,D-transpeptidase family protein [Planctomycetes bacterium]|nr:L,D-transpeptidase family protein [Planctomycetota bacterium]